MTSLSKNLWYGSTYTHGRLDYAVNKSKLICIGKFVYQGVDTYECRLFYNITPFELKPYSIETPFHHYKNPEHVWKNTPDDSPSSVQVFSFTYRAFRQCVLKSKSYYGEPKLRKVEN